jgi:hypothetical protein
VRARARVCRLHFFPAPSADVDAYTNKPEMLLAAAQMKLDAGLLAAGEELRTPAKGDVKMIYCTAVGDGPRTLPASEALIDTATGFPKEAKLQKWQQTLGANGGGAKSGGAKSGGAKSGGCPVMMPLPPAAIAAAAVAAVGLMLLLKK